MFCKYCGSEIEDNSKFCEKCGKKLDEAVPAAEAESPVKKKKSKKKWIILAVAAVLVVVVLAAVIGSSGDDSEESTGNSGSSEYSEVITQPPTEASKYQKTNSYNIPCNGNSELAIEAANVFADKYGGSSYDWNLTSVDASVSGMEGTYRYTYSWAGTPIRLPENSKSRTTAPTGTTVGKVTLQIYFTEVKATPHKARLTALHVIRLQIFLKN